MQYPLISEYIEAIRSAEDNFDQYNALRPVLDDKGNPVLSSGNFAVVFKMRDEQTKRLYAVKCFTRDQERRHENYRRIAEELEFVSSPYLVHFRFLEKELFVDTSQGDAEEYPVLVMDWVEGEPLDRYLRTHLQDTYALQLLAYRFCRMGAWLLSQPFAHGDLKPDNILVKSDGSLVLVDYDGMFVPAMQGEQAGELGSPDFRHPLRTAVDFNEHIDDFSIASIALSLKAIALQSSLYDQFAASDRLLFAASNYMDLGKSALLPTLCSLTSDAELAVLLSIFLLAHAKNSLGMISFRLFLLQEPEKPKEEVWRTNVTDEDREQAIKDEYGVLYSPDGLRLIKAYDNLITYEIKDGTKVICDDAFSDCESLTSIQLPESVTTIGHRTFSGCTSLTFIQLPKAVNSIGNSAFWDCTSLTSIQLPEALTSIGEWAFSGCTSLTSIQLPESVTTIGHRTFSGCKSLTSIQLPKSVNSIGDNPFSMCKPLSIICDSPYFRVVDGLLISKEGKLIANLSDKTHITIPESVNSIGDYAFDGCKSLTSIQLPKAVNSIGYWAFYDCRSLTSIQLPESVNSIGNRAFAGCTSLTSIQLPKSVKSIGNTAFSYCESLIRIQIPKGTMEKFEGLLEDSDLINKLVEE
ncbi:MAG: leucine-rich repeat protein [Parabacteroides sp.]|nr:leucine-rich repeat protein [Parabacteroides sp.]